MNVLADMSVSTVITTMQALCRPGYPSSGKRPSEQSLEGIPILKVRNVTGHGIDLDTDFAPDSDAIRKECARGLLRKDDILITSTGEGTIGRVDIYPYHEFAIADGEITILRLLPGVNPAFVLELLRSEYGQIRMLRHVSGSTGQTHLMPEYVRDMDIPVLAPDLPAVNRGMYGGSPRRERRPCYAGGDSANRWCEDSCNGAARHDKRLTRRAVQL